MATFRLGGLFLCVFSHVAADDAPDRSTPLHAAAEAGAIAETTRQILLGVDVNARDGDHYTPLPTPGGRHVSIIIARLIDHRADTSPTDKNGETWSRSTFLAEGV